MRVIITAGGTGGHIYPALAIINKIKELHPDSEFLYIGTHNRMEKDIIPSFGIPFYSIEIYGFNRKNIFKNGKTIRCFFSSLKKIKKIMKEFKPDVVVGCGGYVSGPVLYTAHKLKIKTFIHEQNSIPGRANRFLAKYVDKIGISFLENEAYFDKKKCVLTGNPCSEQAEKCEIQKKSNYGLREDKKTVLFVMGSLGSSLMNEFISSFLSSTEEDYEVLFVTGKNYYEDFKEKSFSKNVHVIPYVENLPGLMKSIDLMVSRAGASTLSEIIALSVPSILIPSPYVTDNHQYKNALSLKEKNAAFLIEEKELSKEKLKAFIKEGLKEEVQKNMKENLKSLKVENTSSSIVSILEELIRG